MTEEKKAGKKVIELWKAGYGGVRHAREKFERAVAGLFIIYGAIVQLSECHVDRDNQLEKYPDILEAVKSMINVLDTEFKGLRNLFKRWEDDMKKMKPPGAEYP